MAKSESPLIKVLERTQNKCLRIITGAFKAVLTLMLQNKAQVLPVKEILDSTCLKNARRRHASPVQEVINRACKEIKKRVRKADDGGQKRQGRVLIMSSQ